ncbi:MAG TPA: hypothetical protein VH496_21735 [Mycobacterium sp.]|jgi:hypothetical protein
MKKYTVATLAASALAALSIGLAATAAADPTDASDHVGTTQNDTSIWTGWNHYSQTPYGTYQNDNTRFSGARR